MPSRGKKGRAVSFSPSDIATIARSNQYVQRLIEDAELRENVRSAFDSTRSVYGRLANGRAPARALLEDKKLQAELRAALEAVRDATIALTGPPKRRRGRRFGRRLLIITLGFGLALAGSEKLRSKVLDTLFGAEEEFEYTPPASATPSEPAEPVSAA